MWSRTTNTSRRQLKIAVLANNGRNRAWRGVAGKSYIIKFGYVWIFCLSKCPFGFSFILRLFGFRATWRAGNCLIGWSKPWRSFWCEKITIEPFYLLLKLQQNLFQFVMWTWRKSQLKIISLFFQFLRNWRGKKTVYEKVNGIKVLYSNDNYFGFYCKTIILGSQ